VRPTVIRLGVALALLLTVAPAGVEAQQRKIGLLGTLDAEQYKHLVTAFAQGLSESGYVEGQSVTFEPRYAGGRLDRLPILARELIGTRPDVIVVWGDPAIKAASTATGAIPLVMIACDAVAAGLVDNLARPSGNLTGVNCMSAEIATKRLGILREIRPGLSRVGILWNPDDPSKALELSETWQAARAVGLQLQPEEVRDVAAIGSAFPRLKQVDALIVLGDALTFYHRSLIAELATANRLPTIYAFRECVDAGGLLSYGPNKSQMFQLAGRYAAKILKGAKPADLPIEQPTQFELFINVKAAKALNLTIPRTFLLQADHVIE
jgi:putative ABC transport system substrate-binding protein